MTPTEELPLTLNKKGLARLLSLSLRSIERMRTAGAFPPPLPGLRRPRWSTAVVLGWLRVNGVRTKPEEERT